MKKALFSILAVLAVVSVANADPRFGVIGYTDSGAGVYVTDDMYTASLIYGSLNDDNEDINQDDTAISTIGVAANYKMAVDSMTGLTAGLSYKSTSGEVTGVDIAARTQLDLNVGVERYITSNLLMTGEMSVYRTYSNEFDGGDTGTETTLFGGGRFGIAYLF